MSDLTITIPLSWLEFLTWSGFWVVYLYVGLVVMIGGAYVVIKNSFGQHGSSLIRAWRKHTLAPALAFSALLLAWPAVIVWIVCRIGRNKP